MSYQRAAPFSALPGSPSVPVAFCSFCPFFLSLFERWDDGTSGAAMRQRHMLSAPLGSVWRQDLVLPGHAWLPVTWQGRHKTNCDHRVTAQFLLLFPLNVSASISTSLFFPSWPVNRCRSFSNMSYGCKKCARSVSWYNTDEIAPGFRFILQIGAIWRPLESMGGGFFFDAAIQCWCCWAGDALTQQYL